MIGVYKIKSLLTDKIYIGSSVNIHRRWREHFNSLCKNQHPNRKLQRYFNKYGQRNLAFEIVELCGSKSLIEMEQHYIDTLNPYFNVCKQAGNTLGQPGGMKGKTMSEDHRMKIGLAHKGKIVSRETIEKRKETIKLRYPNSYPRKPHSEQTKRKLSEIHKKMNKTLTPEQLAKFNFKGRTITDEHKKIIIDGNKKRAMLRKMQ